MSCLLLHTRGAVGSGSNLANTAVLRNGFLTTLIGILGQAASLKRERESNVNEAISIYTPGVIGCIEQFTMAEEELRQFVIYTYYNKEEYPLYVGCSKSVYDAHYFNSGRLSFFEEVEYVGFVFLDNEAKMKDAKPYYIRARQPKYGRSKYPKLPYLKGCDVHYDELVVSRTELEQYWNEWLALDEGEAERLMAPDRLLVDLEEVIFGEMMQEVAAEEGRRAIEENERLKNDPNFVVPEETHKRMMEIIMGG